MDRLEDTSAIEHRLLELAHTTDAKITAPALAYFAPCSLEDATRVLDDLTIRDQLSMEIEDDGTIVYQLLGRQRLAAPPPLPPPLPSPSPSPSSPAPLPQLALLRLDRRRHDPSPLVAGLLGVLVPGAGHLYAGRFAAALMWFLVVNLGYVLIFPGLVLHLFSIASAAASASRPDPASRHLLLPPPPDSHRTSA